MDIPKDFLETEIKKILDILEKHCKTFRVKDDNKPFVERGVVVNKEREANSASRNDA